MNDFRQQQQVPPVELHDQVQIPMSDIDMYNHQRHQEQETTMVALHSIGGALDHASDLLDGLERDDLLAPAIRRYAADLAAVVGNVARDLDDGNDSEKDYGNTNENGSNENESGNESKRRKWARALLEDAQSQLALEVELEGENDNKSNSNNNSNSDNEIEMVESKSAAGTIAELSEEKVIDALSVARLILLDIEEALLDIAQDEDDAADEIADVGLVVAKMFLWGLQNIQTQVVNTVLSSSSSSNGNENGNGSANGNTAVNDNALYIEILHDSDDESEYNGNNIKNNNNDGERKLPQHKSNSTTKQTTNDTRRDQKPQHRHNHGQKQRMRVLWPPIGTSILSIASWGKHEAIKNPILSIAIAMALWPTALIIAFITPPILAVDCALQSSYDALGSIPTTAPLLHTIETGAANLCQVGKFYYLVSKLVVKQGVRVSKRQIRRRGGVGHVVNDVRCWTVDRVLHPVESVGMAWNTVRAGTGMVLDAASFVRDVAVGSIDMSASPSSRYQHY